MPLMESMQVSTTSAPLLAAASMAATPLPAVSWVCTWIGMFGNSRRSVPINSVAAYDANGPMEGERVLGWLSRVHNTYAWLQQASHVLDAQNVRAALHELPGQVHVVVQVVLVVAALVCDVAGVRDGSLNHTAGLAYALHADITMHA